MDEQIDPVARVEVQGLLQRSAVKPERPKDSESCIKDGYHSETSCKQQSTRRTVRESASDHQIKGPLSLVIEGRLNVLQSLVQWWVEKNVPVVFAEAEAHQP